MVSRLCSQSPVSGERLTISHCVLAACDTNELVAPIHPEV